MKTPISELNSVCSWLGPYISRPVTAVPPRLQLMRSCRKHLTVLRLHKALPLLLGSWAGITRHVCATPL